MTVTQDKEVDIFVGSTIGSIKHIKYHSDASKNSKKCVENLVDIKTLRKEDAITCMQWGDQEQTEILIGKRNQQVEVYSIPSRRVTWRCSEGSWGSSVEPESAGVVGAGRSASGALVAALAAGAVRAWSPGAQPEGGTERPHAGPLRVLRLCPCEPIYATGGEENDLRVWDLEQAASIFSAKSPPHDWLQLRQRTCVTALAWASPHTLAVASDKGYVRLYDTRAQRRAVCSVDTEGKAATCITHSRDSEFIVGFSRGHVQTMDLRGRGKGQVGRGYGGAAGAVTGVEPCGERVYTVSLDRHLRVYELQGKEMLHQQYLTSKLRCLLVQTQSHTPLLHPPEVKEEREVEEDVIEVPDDLDGLFDTMETVGDKPKKNKQKIEAAEEAAKRVKPSTEGSTATTEEDAIKQLLRSTERVKRQRDKKRREKKARSVFHNA